MGAGKDGAVVVGGGEVFLTEVGQGFNSRFGCGVGGVLVVVAGVGGAATVGIPRAGSWLWVEGVVVNVGWIALGVLETAMVLMSKNKRDIKSKVDWPTHILSTTLHGVYLSAFCTHPLHLQPSQYSKEHPPVP